MSDQDKDALTLDGDGSSTTQTKEPVVTEPTNDTIPEPFRDFVGEGKKYKTMEDMAKGFTELDSFAERLKGENAEMRDALGEKLSIEDVVKAIRESTQGNGDDAPRLSEEELEARVTQTVERIEATRSAKANVAKVNDALTKTHGEKAKEFAAAKATELGMTLDDITKLSARSPTAALALLGVTAQKETTTSPSTSTVRTDNFNANNPSGVKGHSYYQKLRKDDPKQYFSPAVQNERYRMLEELGSEKFFST